VLEQAASLHLTITVSRSGDTSTPASVGFATSNGSATQKGDYTLVTGRLNFVDNEINARSGTLRVRAIFPNPDKQLLPGQYANLRVLVGENLGLSGAALIDRLVGEVKAFTGHSNFEDDLCVVAAESPRGVGLG